MLRFKIIWALFFLSFTMSAYPTENQGFDEVCRIYTETKNNNMSIELASKYIYENVKKRVNSKDVLQAHEAIMQAMGDKRYSLFKESAEYVLKQEWDCKTMKAIMGGWIK